MTNSVVGYARQREISPYELGFNTITITNGNSYTSNEMDVTSYNTLELEIFLDRVAATVLTWYFEVSGDGGATWYRTTTSSVSSGTETVSVHSATMTGIGADVKVKYTLSGINDERMRIVFTNTNGSTDTLTVLARLAYIG